MDAIITLKQEHRIIEEALIAFETWASDAVRRGADDRDELRRFVSFFRDFADVCHHGKEEKILFALMADEGLPPDRGPITVLIAEHDRGRSFIRIFDALSRQGRWDVNDRQKLADAVREYVSLLRQHIHKEETMLFPMIEARASEATRAEISRRFEDYEVTETGIGQHERLHELAESLITAHLPRQVEQAHAHHHHH